MEVELWPAVISNTSSNRSNKNASSPGGEVINLITSDEESGQEEPEPEPTSRKRKASPVTVEDSDEEQEEEQEQEAQDPQDPLQILFNNEVARMKLSGQVATGEAKKLYFLTSTDLSLLPCRKPGGWGSGQLRYYNKITCWNASLQKHDPSGLTKKIQSRCKRILNKEKKEEAAEKALHQIQKKRRLDLKNNGSIDHAKLLTKKELENVQKMCRTAIQKVVTFDELRRKNSQNGCVGTITLERIQQFEFCALCGLDDDPNLTTIVKTGAYHVKRSVSLMQVFGVSQLYGKGGRYGCNKQLCVAGDEGITLKYKQSTQQLKVDVWVGYY